MTTGQLRRVLQKCSEGVIRKVLTRLREQGSSDRRARNAYLYEFNREHVAADAIRELANARAVLFQRMETVLGSWRWPPA
jgi:hypothetical protein